MHLPLLDAGRLGWIQAAFAFTGADFNPVARDDPNVTFANLDADEHPFITLEFVCLRCYTEEEGTLEWAANASATIHP